MISTKCGKITCDQYNEHSPSKCRVYEDRRDCAISMKQRGKQGLKSRRKPKNVLGG